MNRDILVIILLCVSTCVLHAQDFDKHLSTARTSYASGKLEDSRFAMQQMLQELDVLIGNEVLKLLPLKMEALNANVKSDNVTANTGLAGVMIHRDYGTGTKTAVIDIMSNSPLIASINAILSLPFIGNSSDGSQKVVKVEGYKGVLQKNVDTETNQTDYTLQLPFGSTLLTLTGENVSESEMLKWASAIPLSEIAKMVQ